MEILHALTETANVAYGGCIFCSNKGSGELIKSAPDISSQVAQYFESYRAKRANKFIAYFQNFTNTYDTIQNLKEKYDSALIDDRIVGLDIATRPDCIDEKVAKLISTYMPKYKVFVELGLQTSNDSTGSLINRGYVSSKFTEAVSILNKYSIPVICHIMVGLPTENTMVSVQETIDGKTYDFRVFKDIIETIKFVNRPMITGMCSVVGKKESQGPLKDWFDVKLDDDTYGEKTWEKGESAMQRRALSHALEKAALHDALIEATTGPDMAHIPYPVTQDMVFEAMQRVEAL